MKKTLLILLACALLLSAVSCSNSEAPAGETTSSTQQSTVSSVGTSESSAPEEERPTGGENALVVYFSATGNTRAVAQTLAQMLNADLYEIVPEQPYTEQDLNYGDSGSRATLEQNDDTARPAISGSIPNIEDYDVIYVGFPIWWGNMPRILYTFFDTYDLSGKTIAPFCTSGSSGISRAAGEIENLEPHAVVTEGLQIRSAAVSASADALSDWLSDIGLAE